MPDILQQPMDTTEVVSESKAPKARRLKPERNYTGLIVLTMILSLVAAVASSGILFLYWQSLRPEVDEPILAVEEVEEEEIQEVSYISFGDYHLPINESLSVNNYDQEAFMASDDGIISYGDARLGIDVSQYQGEIDWQAVADSGVSFALIRLGYRGYGEEGNILLDATFHQNMEGAKAVGIDVGVYFFSQATSVWETTEEAYFVLDHLDGYTLDLPVVFNWEFIDYSASARTSTVPGQCITLYNQVFNEQMQKAGYDTMVYFNQTLAYLYLDLDLLADNPFWLASYSSNPTFYYDFDIWQYSDKGTIDGIEGYVDLNLMFNDLTQGEVAEVMEETPE